MAAACSAETGGQAGGGRRRRRRTRARQAEGRRQTGTGPGQGRGTGQAGQAGAGRGGGQATGTRTASGGSLSLSLSLPFYTRCTHFFSTQHFSAALWHASSPAHYPWDLPLPFFSILLYLAWHPFHGDRSDPVSDRRWNRRQKTNGGKTRTRIGRFRAFRAMVVMIVDRSVVICPPRQCRGAMTNLRTHALHAAPFPFPF